MMATLMTAIVTLINTGTAPGYIGRFAHAWIIAWPIAFTIVLFTAPLVRRTAGVLIREPSY